MDTILKILAEVRPDLDLSKQVKLIDDAILDSFDIIAIVGDLNDAFGVEISVEDLMPENFNTPQAMYELVTKLQEEV